MRCEYDEEGDEEDLYMRLKSKETKCLEIEALIQEIHGQRYLSLNVMTQFFESSDMVAMGYENDASKMEAGISKIFNQYKMVLKKHIAWENENQQELVRENLESAIAKKYSCEMKQEEEVSYCFTKDGSIEASLEFSKNEKSDAILHLYQDGNKSMVLPKRSNIYDEEMSFLLDQ